MSDYTGLDTFTLINFVVLFGIILGIIIFRNTLALRIIGENIPRTNGENKGLVYSDASYKKKIKLAGWAVVGGLILAIGMISILVIKKAPKGVIYDELIVGLPYAALCMFIGLMFYGISMMKIAKIKPTILKNDV